MGSRLIFVYLYAQSYILILDFALYLKKMSSCLSLHKFEDILREPYLFLKVRYSYL